MRQTFAQSADQDLGATITTHHLIINRNHILVGGIKPHYYCLPVAKRESHRQALVAARIGVVSIGYGDGYPRKAPTDTPVLVETAAGMQRTTLKGRVSMDMITIDVTDLPVDVGASVVLWGDGLPADEIAQHCATIAYELFCQVTARVPRLFS